MYATYEQILRRMLARIDDDIDRREGSLIYNALAPAAAEIKQMYIELGVVLNETFASTSSREFLIKRAAERGLAPRPATYAVFKGVFNIAIPTGHRFTSGAYLFKILAPMKGTGFEYTLECETAGSAANTLVGPIVPVEYLNGLTTAELTELLIPGADEEATEAFRARYFGTFDALAFGGNLADYRAKVNGLKGAGGCKAVRTPSGGGTVGVTVISSGYDVPTKALIDSVQTALDPMENQGAGLGIAPIGHTVKVTGVMAFTIDVATTITFAPGWDWPALKPHAEGAIEAYFLELRKSWQDETQLIVRISQIESRLLNLEGVVDITGTTLNEKNHNIVLDESAIPQRGEIVGKASEHTGLPAGSR